MGHGHQLLGWAGDGWLGTGGRGHVDPELPQDGDVREKREKGVVGSAAMGCCPPGPGNAHLFIYLAMH